MLKVSVEADVTVMPGAGGQRTKLALTIEGADFGGSGYGRSPLGTFDAIVKGARSLVIEAQHKPRGAR